MVGHWYLREASLSAFLVACCAHQYAAIFEYGAAILAIRSLSDGANVAIRRSSLNICSADTRPVQPCACVSQTLASQVLGKNRIDGLHCFIFLLSAPGPEARNCCFSFVGTAACGVWDLMLPPGYLFVIVAHDDRDRHGRDAGIISLVGPVICLIVGLVNRGCGDGGLAARVPCHAIAYADCVFFAHCSASFFSLPSTQWAPV